MKKITLTAFALAAAFSTQVFAQSDTTNSTPMGSASAPEATSTVQATKPEMKSEEKTEHKSEQKVMHKKVYHKHYHHYYHHYGFYYGDHPMGWDGTGIPKYIPPGDNPKWYDNSVPGYYGHHYKHHNTKVMSKKFYKHHHVKYRYYEPHCQCYKFSHWDRQRAWDLYNKHWNGVWVQGQDGQWYDYRTLDRKYWKQPEYSSQTTTPASQVQPQAPRYEPSLPPVYDPSVYKGQ